MALRVFVRLFLLGVLVEAQSRALGSKRTHQCVWNPTGPLSPQKGQDGCPVPYNASHSADVSDWAPWTHRPVCASPRTKQDSKYCAFVKDDFRGESGILVLTSPELAAGDFSLVEDFDPQWLDTGPSFTLPTTTPFEVKEMPGKGLGVVATSTIRAGDVIMREHPVIMQTTEISETIDFRQGLWVLEEGFVRLPEKDQRRVFDLARSTGGHVLEDIIRTNTFGATFNNVSHYGLFPDIARINHDCKPNAITRFSQRTLTLEVVAYRDVQPGEELTISYTPLNMLYADRQQMLQEWGFTCTCALCGSPSAVDASDANRGRLQEILSVLLDSGPPSPLRKSSGLVAALTAEMESIVEKEGLAAQAGDFCTILAGVYVEQLGEVETGRRYTELAVEKLVHFAGYDDERTERARGLLFELGGRLGKGLGDTEKLG